MANPQTLKSELEKALLALSNISTSPQKKSPCNMCVGLSAKLDDLKTELERVRKKTSDEKDVMVSERDALQERLEEERATTEAKERSLKELQEISSGLQNEVLRMDREKIR